MADNGGTRFMRRSGNNWYNVLIGGVFSLRKAERTGKKR